MDICLIWAQAQGRAIGKQGTLPWKSPADLRHFRERTLGFPVVMGRCTWESLPLKPLPGRQNFVVTSRALSHPGVVAVPDLRQALELAATARPGKVFIAGGQALYEQAIKIADTLYVTQVATSVEAADAFAPRIDESQFELVERRSAPDVSPALCFEVYRRRRTPR